MRLIHVLTASALATLLLACAEDKKETPPTGAPTAVLNEPPAVQEPEPANMPTGLKAFDQELPAALTKVSNQTDQTCMVNNEYSESLFGLSTLITVFCNLEKVTSKYVHEFGFRRTADLHLHSMYVVKKAFRTAGFSMQKCDDLPNTSESGLQISGQSTCTFVRTKK